MDSSQDLPDGGREPQKVALIYYLAKFFRKLLENEENWRASKILLCRLVTTKTFVGEQ